jgi:hypothetical protein
MATLRLDPHKPGAGLMFDLKEILAALQPFALTACWTVSAGAARHGEIDATGDGATALETLARSGERVSGERLFEIVASVRQVIDGQFEAFGAKTASEPQVVVTAEDSTFWRIASQDLELLAQALLRLGGEGVRWRARPDAPDSG